MDTEKKELKRSNKNLRNEMLSALDRAYEYKKWVLNYKVEGQTPKEYGEMEYKKDLEFLEKTNFKNKIWDNDFMGLKFGESICAVACPLSNRYEYLYK